MIGCDTNALPSLRLDPPGGQCRSGNWRRILPTLSVKQLFPIVLLAIRATARIEQLGTIVLLFSATALPGGRVISKLHSVSRQTYSLKETV